MSVGKMAVRRQEESDASETTVVRTALHERVRCQLAQNNHSATPERKRLGKGRLHAQREQADRVVNWLA